MDKEHILLIPTVGKVRKFVKKFNESNATGLDKVSF